MREALGDGYAEALRRAYPKGAAERRLRDVLVGEGRRASPRLDPDKRTGTRRFGLITTNSLRQTFNRRVVAAHLADRKDPLSLLFAIPDHPWVEAAKAPPFASP